MSGNLNRRIIIIIIIIIMIALTGANPDFYNLLTASRTVSNTYTQVLRAQSCNTSGTCHVQHVVRHVVQRDSSATKFDVVYIASN